MRFIAYNPVLYDPTEHIVNFQEGDTAGFPAAFPIPLDSPPELVFPTTFPITFFKIDETLDINYTGTWLEYPVLRLIGPLLNPIITNEVTGEVLELSYALPEDDEIVIDLAPGRKTVTDLAGNNLIGVVTPQSDLGTWHIAPAPEAPGGVNTIHALASNIDTGSAIRITWKARYFGI